MPHIERPKLHGRKDHDKKCPDGFTCYGWRKITKGGYVRFSAGRHYCNEFIGFENQWVYVTLDDPWGCNVDVWIDEPWRGKLVHCYNEKEWLNVTL